ncbi:MAG TPA: glycosyltransferase family 4 protein [Acidimicrobiales bacterium]|nr:glycosyltransferase family 4 protein [Acidimicrobiales bacterium]
MKGGGEVPLVLHVIPTAAARGAQREARALVDRLDAPGQRHHRLLSLFDGPTQIAVDESLGFRSRRQPTASGFEPLLALRLAAYLRRRRPAVVVAHGGDPLKYIVPAWPTPRRRLVYYATGTFGAAGRPLQLRLWRALVDRATVVAAEGEQVMAECRDLLRVPPRRLVLAPNGRDPGAFHPASAAEGQRRGLPAVVFVGALTPGKGPEVFVEVVGALRRRGGELHALMCGDGPLRPVLEGPARAACVDMLGPVDDVAAVLRRAHLMLFPSRPTGEGMPGVLIEAGLSGLPVVATDVPGARSIVEDGTSGFLVAVDDTEAMVRALQRLLADPALRRRMGDAARSRCLEHFAIEPVVERWRAFLTPLVEGSGR